MGDEKNETWTKYYYKLSPQEFSLFEDLELIDHTKIQSPLFFLILNLV